MVKSTHKSKTAITIVLAMVVLVMIVAAIIWFVLGNSPMTQQEKLAQDSISASNPVVLGHSSTYFDLGKRPETASEQIKAIVSRRPDIQMDQAQLEKSFNKTELVQLADPKKVFQVLPWLTERQRTDGRKFVSYDAYVIESKFVGDRLDILLPDVGILGQGIVDSVETLDKDIVRWQGHFDNFNDTRNSFTITQTLGDRYAVGVYETPFGSFNMESKDGYGWVVNQQTDFHLPENGKDYVESADPHQH